MVGLSHRRPVVVVALLLGLLTPALAAAGQVEVAPVTFATNVAPVLQCSCVSCHRPGSIAPMSLVTYENVRPWARAIRERVARAPSDPERMPPWFIETNVGIQRFKDDPSLSDDEIAMIAAWVDGGSPRGEPADMPAAREWSDGGWNIGTPDLVVSSPLVTVEAVASDQNIQLQASPVGLTEDRYVRAVEIREVRPGEDRIERIEGRAEGDLNYFVLHHAVITGASIPADGEATVDGFQFEPGAFRVVHELGQNATIFPDDVGVVLRGGSRLTWDIHTHSVGKQIVLRIDVGFVFHPKGYTPKYRQPAGSVSMTLASQADLDIPAGEDDVMVDGYYVMPQPAKMLTFEPHLHSSGKRMCAEAIYGNGLSRDLELRRLQPQLGQDLQLRRRRRTTPTGGDDHSHDRLVRQHGEKSEGRGSQELEGLWEPLHRRHVADAAQGAVSHRRGICRRSGDPCGGGGADPYPGAPRPSP